MLTKFSAFYLDPSWSAPPFGSEQYRTSKCVLHLLLLLSFCCVLTCVQESERKAYNPRPFCKTYTMDKQPLNTGEQKDMTEFFTDLITKIEEMSQELVTALSAATTLHKNPD